MHPSRHTPGKSAQSGFTLMETLVVMIIGIIILAGAAAGVSKIFSESQISVEARNITQLQRNIQGMRRHDGYAGLTNNAAYQFNAIPANMYVDTSTAFYTIKNSWGGLVYITEDDAISQDNPNLFNILYLKVPEEACQQLILKLVSMDWLVISVINGNKGRFPFFNLTGTAVSSNGVTISSVKKPDLSSVQYACSGGNIVLTFVGR